MVALVLLALGPLDLWLARLPRAARPETPPAISTPRTAGDKTVMVIVWGYAILAAGIPMLTLILTALTRGPVLPRCPRTGPWPTSGPASRAVPGPPWRAAPGSRWPPRPRRPPSAAWWLAWPAGVARPAGHRGHAGLRHSGFGARVGIIIGYGRWLDGSALSSSSRTWRSSGYWAPSRAGGPGPAAARRDPRRAAERRPARHRGPHRGTAAAQRGRRYRGRAGVRPGLPRTDHVHHLVRAGHRDLRGGGHEPAGSRRRRRDRGARPGTDRAGGGGGRPGRRAGAPHQSSAPLIPDIPNGP